MTINEIAEEKLRRLDRDALNAFLRLADADYPVPSGSEYSAQFEAIELRQVSDCPVCTVDHLDGDRYSGEARIEVLYRDKIKLESTFVSLIFPINITLHLSSPNGELEVHDVAFSLVGPPLVTKNGVECPVRNRFRPF